MTMINVKKTKTVVVNDRDIQNFNAKYGANLEVNSREIGFSVPADMNIETREIEMLLATHAGMITAKELKAEIEGETELKDMINDE